MKHLVRLAIAALALPASSLAQELRITDILWQWPESPPGAAPCVTGGPSLCAPGTDTTAPPYTTHQTRVVNYPQPHGALTVHDSGRTDLPLPMAPGNNWVRIEYDVPVDQAAVPAGATFRAESFASWFGLQGSARASERYVFTLLPTGGTSSGSRRVVLTGQVRVSTSASGSGTASLIARSTSGAVLASEQLFHSGGSQTRPYELAFRVDVGDSFWLDVHVQSAPGAPTGNARAIVEGTVALRRGVHALLVGIDDEARFGLGFDGAASAARVHARMLAHPAFDSAQLITRSYSQDSVTTHTLIRQAISSFVAPQGPLRPGDLFVFMICTHGAQETPTSPPGDEVEVHHRTNPWIPGLTIASREDEVLVLCNSATDYFARTDDDLREWFDTPEWAVINKLFIMDTCFGGGYWGSTANGDSGDFATLPRSALIAASDEASFSYCARGVSDFGHSFLSIVLDGVLQGLAFQDGFEVDELVRSLEAWGNLLPFFSPYQNASGGFVGSICGAIDYTQFYDDEVPADVRIELFRTSDFEGGVGTCTSGASTCTPIGFAYCDANPNSTGLPALIEAEGSRSVAANDLTLHARALPHNAFGYFLASLGQFFVANPGGSHGNLCLGPVIGRAVGGVVFNSGGMGEGSVVADLTAMPQPTGPIAVMPGDTWFFQAWFRDSVAGTPTSNFTNAIGIAFE